MRRYVGRIAERGEDLLTCQAVSLLNFFEAFTGSKSANHGGDVNARAEEARFPEPYSRVHRDAWENFHVTLPPLY